MNMEVMIAAILAIVQGFNTYFPKYKKLSPILAVVLGGIGGYFFLGGNVIDGIYAGGFAVGIFSSAKNITQHLKK